MATIPIYDEATLPCLIYPMTNTREPAVKYLGNKALLGRELATANFVVEEEIEISALYDFFKIDCNNGLEPFLIPLPFFGETVVVETPALLVKLIGNLGAEKVNFRKWTGDLSLEVLGAIVYTIDGGGDFILSDTGDFTFSAEGDLVATVNKISPIDSFREVFF